MKLRIKDLREDNDLTQKEVAKVLMCDQSLYSKYERGEREIPLSLLIKLADCYGTSLDYLTCRTDNPNIKITAVLKICISRRLLFLFINCLIIKVTPQVLRDTFE